MALFSTSLISWAPDLPTEMAAWMISIGLHNQDRFRLTIGQNEPTAYQEAVHRCSKATGLTETIIEGFFFGLLGVGEGQKSFSSIVLATTSTEELSRIGVKAKTKFMLELATGKGTQPSSQPATPKKVIRKGLKASFSRPKRPRLGIFRATALKPETAMRDKESEKRRALLRETLFLVTGAGMPHAAVDPMNPEKE